MATQKVVTAILGKMLLTFPPVVNDKEQDQLRQVWLDVLDDIDDISLQTAAVEYLKSANQWRPAPGVLRDRALKLMGIHPATQADKMWQNILERHENHHDGQYDVDQQALEIMVSIGGWDRLGRGNGDAGFVRKEFIELYQAKKQDEATLALPAAQNLKRLEAVHA